MLQRAADGYSLNVALIALGRGPALKRRVFVTGGPPVHRRNVEARSRLGFRQQRGHLVMTIQRAKNREFPNVIVLWPHTATGGAEHLRRLLYNGITRAQNHCTVIVLGQNRINAPPFAP